MESIFSKLFYTESTWPDVIGKKLTIDCVSRKVIIDTPDERQIRKCTEADWQKIESLFSKCNFPDWKDNYYEPVLDGTSWTLVIEFAGGKSRESHGSNGYPAEWKQFQSLKRFCKRLMKQDD